MFSSIGIMEIIVIAVVTILIVKPEDFPGFLRKIGHYYGKFHSTMFKFKNYNRDTFDQITSIDGETADLDSGYSPDADYNDPYYSHDSVDHTVSMDDHYDEEDEESGYDLYFSDDDYCEGYDEDMEYDDDDYGDYDDDHWDDALTDGDNLEDDKLKPTADDAVDTADNEAAAENSTDDDSDKADLEVETEAAAG